MTAYTSSRDAQGSGPAGSAPDRIYVLDEAEVREGAVEAYRSAVLDDYRPEAAARGLTLEAVWLSPPLVLDGGGNTLYVLWSYPDLAAFWRARFADTESKQDWWSRTAPMIVARKRSILTDFAGVG